MSNAILPFVATGAVTLSPSSGTAYANLPPANGADSDAVLVNSGERPVWLALGTGAGFPVGPNSLGGVLVPAGSQLLASDLSPTFAASLASAQMVGAWCAGRGSVTLTRGSRKNAPGMNASVAAPWNDVIPMRDAQRLRTEAAPVVVITGSSIGLANGNNNVTMLHTTNALIQDRLIRCNPSKNFTFYDRSIGGSTMAMLGNTASVPVGSQPSWWTSGTWMAQIGSLAPSQVYVCTGENDAAFFDASALKAFLAAMAALANPPDVFLVTPVFPGPSFSTISDPRFYWTFPASIMRNTARTRAAGMVTGGMSVGVIDIGEFQARNVAGVSYVSQALRDVVPAAAPQVVTLSATTGGAYAYTFKDQPDGDFYLSVTFPGQAATLFNNNTSSVYFEIGLGFGVCEMRFDPGAGRAYFHLYATFGGSLFSGGSMAIPASGDITFTVAKRAHQIYATMNGVVAFNTRAPMNQTPFSMVVTCTSPGYVPTMIVNEWSVGVNRPFIPVMTNAQYFGEISGIGGGGDIHPSTMGYQLIASFIDAQDLTAAPHPPPPSAATLSGNYTVALAGASEISLDPNGANRIVTLPAITASNAGVQFIINNIGAANTLQVQTSGAVNVGSAISAGTKLKVVATPAGTWVVVV